jgi:putative endonuclease
VSIANENVARRRSPASTRDIVSQENCFRLVSARRASGKAEFLNMKYYIYLLLSEVDNKPYLGSTNNLEKRVNQHNNGLVKSTRTRKPLKLIYNEEFENVNAARKREHFYKTASGRRQLKKIFESLVCKAT